MGAIYTESGSKGVCNCSKVNGKHHLLCWANKTSFPRPTQTKVLGEKKLKAKETQL